MQIDETQQFMLDQLAMLRKGTGTTVADFSALIGRQPLAQSNRGHSGWISGLLHDLEKEGLVTRMDNQKPIVWQLAPTKEENGHAD